MRKEGPPCFLAEMRENDNVSVLIDSADFSVSITSRHLPDFLAVPDDSTIDNETSISSMIDAVCDSFEQALRKKEPVRLEDFLAKVKIVHRERLFRELLEIELSIRQETVLKGEPLPNEDGADGSGLFVADPETEFRQRFPEYASIVRSVVRRVIKPKQLGDYDLLEELGHGGMGVVYRAIQKYLNQEVAIKVLPRCCLDDSQTVNRFRREMLLIGALNHPNIVRALNAGESLGTHYLVMEFVHGKNLGDVIRTALTLSGGEEGPMPLGAACEVIRQAALGLDHVHQFGLVHRDMKPANLMIDAGGTVKILDLGLGKFSAGAWTKEAPNHSLTQMGTTMGTVDYMAPEQWENSSQVDIRSDIYGLGATFYFLLSGAPPYDSPRFDTQRKKMMAHMVGEVPDLEKVVSAPPKKLVAVFQKMMAKDIAERFRQPIEIADALEPFADREELRRYLEKMLESGVLSPTAKPISSSLRGTPDTRPNRKPRFSGMPKDTYSRLSLLLLLGVVFVVISGMIAMRLLETYRGTIPVAALGSETKGEADRIRMIGTDVAQLPGLDGEWWFNEIPWHLPFVREKIDRHCAEIADSLEKPLALGFRSSLPVFFAQTALGASRAVSTGNAEFPETELPGFQEANAALTKLLGTPSYRYYDPNLPAVYAWLWEVVSRVCAELTPAQLRLLDDLKRLTDENLPPLQQAEPLREAYERFENAHESDNQWSAADLYTKALLLHRLASLTTDARTAMKSEQYYREAIELYEQGETADDATYRKMWFFCQSDMVRLLPLASGRFEKSLDILRQVFDRRGQRMYRSDLFLIELLAAYGDMARERGDYNDALFTRAKRVIRENAFLTNRSHPLAAYVCERSAWSLIDQWKVDDAAKEFSEALRIRQTNFQETDGPKNPNPFAQIYIFHNRHGLAMTYRYQGNTDKAIEEYDGVLADIAAELARIDALPAASLFPGFQRYRANLLERWSNSYERAADCVLYGGAAAGPGSSKAITFSQLTSAAEKYAKAYEHADNSTKPVMACKHAIMTFLLGKPEEAASILKKMDEKNRTILGNRQRTDLIRQVADALISRDGSLPSGTADEPALENLRTILNQVQLSLNEREAMKRETLEIRLFCMEHLLARDIRHDRPRQTAGDIGYMQVLLHFSGRNEMRPFLRRYFDLLIRARLHSIEEATERKSLLEIVGLIRRSRVTHEEMQRGEKEETTADATAPATLLLFHFTEEASDGIAVFCPQDGRPLRRFAVPYTRDVVRAEKTLALDAELVDLVQKDRREGIPVDISWSDAACWARPKDAITDADWPFEEQLPLHQNAANP